MSRLADVFNGLSPAPVVPPHPPRAEASPVQYVEPPPKRFKLLTAAELHLLPRLQWVIHGVMPVSGCAAIFGPSGCGKSFLTLDLVAALAEGRDWFGHRVPHALRVLCIVLEGEAGFRLRVAAWERENGRPFPESVRFMFEAFELASLGDTLALAAATELAGGVDVIIIDTLNRAAPGADENTSSDMGRILEGVRDLQSLTETLVVLVHHSGKDASKGMRGHSSLYAALDAAIEVSRTDDRRDWKVAKAKDGEDGQSHPFRLSVVDLGDDEDGEPITSCVVVSDDEPAVQRPKLPKAGNQRIVYDALGPLFRETHTFGKAGAPAVRPCIEFDAAIVGVRDRLPVEPKRRTERAQEAVKGLIARGVVGHNEGWIWLI